MRRCRAVKTRVPVTYRSTNLIEKYIPKRWQFGRRKAATDKQLHYVDVTALPSHDHWPHGPVRSKYI